MNHVKKRIMKKENEKRKKEMSRVGKKKNHVNIKGGNVNRV